MSRVGLGVDSEPTLPIWIRDTTKVEITEEGQVPLATGAEKVAMACLIVILIREVGLVGSVTKKVQSRMWYFFMRPKLSSLRKGKNAAVWPRAQVWHAKLMLAANEGANVRFCSKYLNFEQDFEYLLTFMSSRMSCSQGNRDGCGRTSRWGGWLKRCIQFRLQNVSGQQSSIKV